MSGVLDIFNADKWRDAIRDFDAKRVKFLNEVASLTNARGATPALENERRKLLSDASPINAQIETLHKSLSGVRDALWRFGSAFGLGDARDTMAGLGVAPLIVGATLAGVAFVVNAISKWLEASANWAGKNRLAETLAKSGADADAIAKAVNQATTKEQPELFGFKVGGLKWIAIIAGIVIAGPYFIKGLEKYKVLK